MPYGYNGQQSINPMYQPTPPVSNNSLWVGNNYSTGYSQMNRPMNGMMQPMNPTNQQPMNNILQVMGPESARNYQVGPNSHVILMDSNRPVFYMKRSDDSGFSEIKAFEFHEVPLDPEPIMSHATTSTQSDHQASLDNYVTKSDFEDFKKTIEELVMNNA